MSLKETEIIEPDERIKKNPGKILLSIEVSRDEAIRIIGQLSGQIGIDYVSRESQEQHSKHFAGQEKGTT